MIEIERRIRGLPSAFLIALNRVPVDWKLPHSMAIPAHAIFQQGIPQCTSALWNTGELPHPLVCNGAIFRRVAAYDLQLWPNRSALAIMDAIPRP